MTKAKRVQNANVAVTKEAQDALTRINKLTGIPRKHILDHVIKEWETEIFNQDKSILKKIF